MPPKEKKLTQKEIIARKASRAASAKKYRENQKKTGFSVLRVWVPDEIKEELNDMVQVAIDQHFASIEEEE